MAEDKTQIKNQRDTLRMPQMAESKSNSPESDFSNLGFSGYTIQRRLSASTGEAEIFLAKKENRNYVIKYYYPNFSPKYEILERLKGIQHPDILPLHEYGKHRDRFFEVQDYAEGGTLGDKKEDGTYKYLPLSEEKLIGVVQEVLNAFEFFHSKGIIHRDIKPANLFYKNANGTDIIVGDFGISSRVNVEEDMTKRKTKSHSRTEGYAAPEIYSGIIGKELDYYSLGITIYELHTGTNPFKDRNEGHIIRDTIEGRVIEDLLSRTEAKNFSKKIQTLLSGLLTMRHDKRWGLSEVKRFLNGETVEVFKPPMRDLKPFVINGQNYTDLKEIAGVLEKDRANGKKLFYRGILSRWAEGIDIDLAGKIADIQEENAEAERQEFGFQRLLFFLNPETPFRSASGMEVKNREDFQKLLKSGSKEVLTELKEELSMLNAWLFQNGLGEIQTLVKKALSLGYSEKRTLLYIRLSLEEGFTLPDGGKIFKPEELLNLPTRTMNRLYTELKDESSELSVWFEVTDPEKYRLWISMEKSLENFLDLLSGEWEKKESERKLRAEQDRQKSEEVRKAKEDAERKAKAEEERKRREVESRSKLEELRTRLEELKRAKEEAERKVKIEEEKKRQEELKRSKEEAERNSKVEEERKRLEKLKKRELPKTYTNSIGMEFVLIPAGEFMMGAVPQDKDAGDIEKPQHMVRITKPFYMGKYPLTQEEWDRLIPTGNPSYFKYAGKRAPLTNVSWEAAQEYANFLSERDGKIYRLPTEAEWEYAARAGTKTIYYWGDILDKEYCWYEENSGSITQPVGKKKPNAFGLHDMIGNVWEWCQDWFGEDYYIISTDIDPKGPIFDYEEETKAIRGGCFNMDKSFLRVSQRLCLFPDENTAIIGMRLVMLP